MKTIIALAIIGYAIAVQGNPPANALCMGNNDGAQTCSACYNDAQSTYGARQLNTDECSVIVVNAITDCKWYWGKITGTFSAADCGECNSKIWMNVQTVTSAITCSDTATDVACDAVVPNCDQSYCLTTAGPAHAKGCRQCSSGYHGGPGTVTDVGYPTCVNTSAILNCSIHAAIVNTDCYLCIANYAVASTGTSCVSFTNDAGCRLLTSDLWCKECKNNYFFTTTTCTLGYDLVAINAEKTAAAAAAAATATAACPATAAAATGANLMAVSAFLAALLVFFN